MEDVFSLIEQSMKNTSRNYGDVRLSKFGCGCKILTARDDPQYTVFEQLCVAHREECKALLGERAVDKIIFKYSEDSQ